MLIRRVPPKKPNFALTPQKHNFSQTERMLPIHHGGHSTWLYHCNLLSAAVMCSWDEVDTDRKLCYVISPRPLPLARPVNSRSTESPIRSPSLLKIKKSVECRFSKCDSHHFADFLGELGLLGITVGEDYGGIGLDAVAAVIANEEISYSDPGFCLSYLAHSTLFVNNLAQVCVFQKMESVFNGNSTCFSLFFARHGKLKSLQSEASPTGTSRMQPLGMILTLKSF